ncbi:MAG: phosphate acyltransferase [Holosporales bacterium]|jgi:glycerol-3-phosphate acyltransferase PlsX|nr:phosphate acyltransferase [Holosporales bacterium]
MVTIAVDAMGGDFGHAVTVDGARLALDLLRKSGILSKEMLRFLFFGDGDKISEELKKHIEVAEITEIVHADVIVTNEMKPIDAMRHRHDSNLGLAIDAVARGRADAVVSAANTGAYIALAKTILGTLPFVERPAIPAVMPHVNGKSIVLDLGANLECSAERLVQFALMGESFARSLLKKESPSVGLLNVGAEEMKGHATVQTAGRLLHNISKHTSTADGEAHTKEKESLAHSYFNFHGFIEGNDIFRGVTDVVVTDGFSGNIALKAIEGVIWFFFKLLKDSMKDSLVSKLVGLTVLPTLRKIKKTIDPRLYNGAVLLGLKKIAVKSHGGADSFGFAQAIKVGVQMVQSSFLEDVEKRLQLLPEIQ